MHDLHGSGGCAMKAYWQGTMLCGSMHGTNMQAANQRAVEVWHCSWAVHLLGNTMQDVNTRTQCNTDKYTSYFATVQLMWPLCMCGGSVCSTTVVLPPGQLGQLNTHTYDDTYYTAPSTAFHMACTHQTGTQIARTCEAPPLHVALHLVQTVLPEALAEMQFCRFVFTSPAQSQSHRSTCVLRGQSTVAATLAPEDWKKHPKSPKHAIFAPAALGTTEIGPAKTQSMQQATLKGARITTGWLALFFNSIVEVK